MKHYAHLLEDCAGDSKKSFQVAKSVCKEHSHKLLLPYDSPQQMADDFQRKY